MRIDQRISAFHKLGQQLSTLADDEFQSLAERARNENPWFIEQNVRMAIDSIIKFLDKNTLQKWVTNYNLEQLSEKKIAIVMAGNIPLVGFHDFLCVLIAGHKVMVKLSSKDSVLTNYIIQHLIAAEPLFESYITIAERLKDFDAVIATGSDNSARYFEYYFGKYPHIIRKNRTSVAIIQGNESDEELKKLGIDIFSYFGLGCRNVSKIFIPRNYDLANVFKNLEPFQSIIHHHKYCNNYDYQKSILLVNRVPFLDNDFILLQENDRIVSPISVLYYEFYNDGAELTEKLIALQDKIQCVVGNTEPATTPFGQAQFPSIDDYADRVDTLKFLSELH